jgi:hypothetical protein
MSLTLLRKEPPLETTTSYTPAGMEQPETDPAAALLFLRSRIGIDFTAPYNDPGDRRRELGVLAVDLGRRLLDVLRLLGGEAEREILALDRLREAASLERVDMSGDRPDLRAGVSTMVLHARAAELDRTLRMVAVAYKQAWWSDAAVPAAESAGS